MAGMVDAGECREPVGWFTPGSALRVGTRMVHSVVGVVFGIASEFLSNLARGAAARSAHKAAVLARGHLVGLDLGLSSVGQAR